MRIKLKLKDLIYKQRNKETKNNKPKEAEKLRATFNF